MGRKQGCQIRREKKKEADLHNQRNNGNKKEKPTGMPLEWWPHPSLMWFQKARNLSTTRREKAKKLKTKPVHPSPTYDPFLTTKAWWGNVVYGGISEVPIPVQWSRRRHLPDALEVGSGFFWLKTTTFTALLDVGVVSRSLDGPSPAGSKRFFRFSLQKYNQITKQLYQQEETPCALADLSGALGGSLTKSRFSSKLPDQFIEASLLSRFFLVFSNLLVIYCAFAVYFSFSFWVTSFCIRLGWAELRFQSHGPNKYLLIFPVKNLNNRFPCCLQKRLSANAQTYNKREELIFPTPVLGDASGSVRLTSTNETSVKALTDFPNNPFFFKPTYVRIELKWRNFLSKSPPKANCYVFSKTSLYQSSLFPVSAFFPFFCFWFWSACCLVLVLLVVACLLVSLLLVLCFCLVLARLWVHVCFWFALFFVFALCCVSLCLLVFWLPAGSFSRCCLVFCCLVCFLVVFYFRLCVLASAGRQG